jgi:hypothetical protein
MKRLMNRWESGQSFIEMAFGTVILVLLLGGLIDVGRSFLILVAVENAAGEGVLFGITNPECLTSDHAITYCVGNENILTRVKEEGKPIINLTDENSEIDILIDDVNLDDSPEILGGATLTVEVKYTYSPVTPLGFLIWGDTAEVRAQAHQEILSPPRPGYQY